MAEHKKIFAVAVMVVVILVSVSGFFIGFVSAQEETVLAGNNKAEIFVPASILQAEAGIDKNIVVGRQLLFSGVASTGPADQELEYSWDFGDGESAFGVDVTHIYRTPGIYRVTLTVSDAENASIDEVIVSVDKDIILLITDNSVNESQVQKLQERSSTQGILLVDVRVAENGGAYQVETSLIQSILENKDNIKQAKSIVIWTKENIGLNALIGASQELSKTAELDSLGFKNKNVVVITEERLGVTARIAQTVYSILTPQALVLTPHEAIESVVINLDTNILLGKLQEQEIDYQLLGVHTQRPLNQLKPWNFLSYVVTNMVNNGVPLNTIYLILILPVLATIIAFSRQVVGLKAFGIYAPSLVAISFLATGLKYGLGIFIMVLVIGTLGRLIARKTKLLYLPRMAMVLTLVSLSILALFFIGSLLNKAGLIAISVFPILIMVIITEKFVSAQIEQGSKTALKLVVETLFLSIVSYYLATWESFRVLILGYPEVILITLILNFLIGRWAGLRLLEIYRFRKVIKHVQLAEKK